MHTRSSRVWQKKSWKASSQKKKHRLVLLRIGPFLPSPHHHPRRLSAGPGPTHLPSVDLSPSPPLDAPST